jgi:hypothetical protein
MVTWGARGLSYDPNTAQGLGVSQLRVTRKHVCDISCYQHREKQHFWLRLKNFISSKYDREGVDWVNMTQGKGQVVDCCDEGDEHLGSVKFGDIFDYLREKKVVGCLESVR